MKFFPVFFLMLTSCAGYRTLPLQYVDVEFIPYVSKFEQEIGIKSKVSLYLTDLVGDEDRYVGLCRIVDGAANSVWNVVRIDRKKWKMLSEPAREQTIYHELGHCALGRQHTNVVIMINEQYIPSSIMYPTIFGHLSYYSSNREHYIQELRDASN